MEKIILGLDEEITLINTNSEKKILARIDSGANKSSIDVSLAAEMHLGPVIDSKVIKNASGSELRPVIKAKVRIHNKEVETQFTITDRSHMKYKMLIGQNILKDGFLIDCSIGENIEE
jgi:hypothetical protein